MNLPPRSRHLPARKPSSWMYFVVRLLLPLRGLCPASSGAGTASVRVALSRAARIPLLTRVRRRFSDVTKLLRGEFLGVDVLVADESRLGVRARVRALGLSSRPGMGTVGLVKGPTSTASAAYVDATSSAGLASRASIVDAPVQLRILSQVALCRSL